MKTAIVCAHIDDELLSCSGIISKTNPDDLVIVYTSISEYFDLDGKQHRSRNEAISERDASIKILCGKVTPTILDLYYPTKEVPYNSEIIEKLDKIFRMFEIELVYTHSPSDTHSDHANTGRAVFTAARRVPNLFVFEPVFPAKSIDLYHINAYIDISNTFDKKIKALKAQTS